MKKIILLIIIFSFELTLFSQNKPTVKDDPHGRENYLFQRIKSPITNQVPKNIHQKELQFLKSAKSGLINPTKSKISTWINRGPWNVGGRTRALAIDLTNSNIILAAGVSGGLWRSTDAGNSWTKVSIPSNDNSGAITAIAQDSRTNNQQIWYYVTGEYLGNSASEVGAAYRGSGIYRSVDSGKTWTQVVSSQSVTNFSSDFNYCWDVKVNPVNGDVYVATYGGIYKSTDGLNFSSTLYSTTGSNYSPYTDVEITSDGTIYATMSYEGDKNGIFKSTDNGTNWTNISPSFYSDYKRIVIASAPSNTNKVYFLGVRDSYNTNEDQNHLLWIYDNSSNSWTDKTSMLPAQGGDTGNFDSQDGYDLVIKVKPDDSSVVFFGGTSLYRTTDGFSNSSNISWVGGYTPSNTSSFSTYTNHHPDQHSLAFDPNNTLHLYSGHDGGISYTANCLDSTTNSNSETIDWTFMNNGYLTTQDYVVAIDYSGHAPKNIIAGFQDNGTWLDQATDPTYKWDKFNSGDGAYCAIADNGTAYYSSSQKGKVYVDFFSSTGNYIGWARVYPDLNSPLFVTPFVIDPNDNNIMYMLDKSYIWRDNNLNELRNNLSSQTAPTDWVKLSNSQIQSGYYSAIAVSKNPTNIVYAGTSDGKIYKYTNPNNSNPTPTNITGTDFPSGYISSIAIDPYDANKIIVTFSNYQIRSIFYSTDGGISWTDVSGNLEQYPDGSGNGPSVRWVAILKSSKNNIYFVATSIGLFSTTDLSSSTTWTHEGSSTIGNVITDMVTTRASDGTVVVGTHGNGIYSAQYSASTKELNTIEKLKIYPNPAKTIIHIFVAHRNSKLLIHDADGRIIFFANIKTKGEKSFDLSSLSQGVYLIRLYSGQKISESKLIIK